MAISFFRTLLLTASFCLLLGCDDYNFPESSYPRVESVSVFATASGFKLRGKIVQVGEEPITDHGFVWGSQAAVTERLWNEGMVRLGPVSETGTFEVEITELTPGRTYFIKAFVFTETTKVYGNFVELK